MKTNETDSTRPLTEPANDDSGSTLHEEANDGSSNEATEELRNQQAGDEENHETPPLPVGFWDESLNNVRMDVFNNWSIISECHQRTVRSNTLTKAALGLFTFIMTVLSLYWAVLFRVEENMAALKVAVVSFDGQSAPFAGTKPLVGRAVEQAARQQAEIRKGVIGFEVHDPAEFNYDPIAVRQAVFDEHFWAGIVVNNNATTLLQQAVSQGNRTYDPLGAMQVVYVQARDETTYANYITPQLNRFTTNVQARFGEQWITQILANTSLDQATYSQAPQALSPAIGVSTYNLRPFGPPQATPAVTIGLIYLIIIAFFNFSFVSVLRLLLGKTD